VHHHPSKGNEAQQQRNGPSGNNRVHVGEGFANAAEKQLNVAHYFVETGLGDTLKIKHAEPTAKAMVANAMLHYQ